MADPDGEVPPAAEDPPDPAARRARRRRDIWQLHVPLVLVLTLCTVLTVVEARRAGEGVWRAWAYTFEWPLIGLFSLWIWNRYRVHGTVTRGIVERWRSAQRPTATLAEEHPVAPDGDTAGAEPPQEDVELTAWERYKADLCVARTRAARTSMRGCRAG